VFENVLIDDSSQVVYVRNEEVLLALREKFIDETRVHDGVEKISVTGRVPRRLVFESGTRSREEGFLVDTRVTRLVESHEFDTVVRVLLDDSCGIFISVERVHEDERNVDVVSRVEVLSTARKRIQRT